mmetsp:Transcript_31308/g.81585  ORF Transcript_31308/g.81585 Transcript_31308/m.81585 type:complete len:503 (-) Transcript_31308:355-1863(-)
MLGLTIDFGHGFEEPCFAVPAPTSTSDVSGWLLLKGIHEAEALLPSPWQQKYLNVGQALVEPIDLKENMRQVVVLGPSGVGKSALIKHLTRAGNVAVGESKMTTLPERRHVRPDLQLWDMPGYNVWMHQGAEDTDDGTTPQTLTVLDFLCAEGHSELIDQADAVMYVVGNRGTARDGEILQRMMDYGKMIFLVITHCEELGYCGPFQESSAQNERAIIVRDTLKAIGTSGGLAAALERMPIFCVQCPLPHGLAYQSKASMVESVLDFNCKCFDFPALSDFLYSASGLSGQLLLQSCMGSMLQETLEGYIACKTAGLDAAPETSHESSGPEKPSSEALVSWMWTMLDMMELVGMVEIFEDQFKKRAGRAAIGSYTSRSQGMIPEWRERMKKTADNAHWKQLLSEQADLDSMIKALHEKLKEVFGNTSAYSALALEGFVTAVAKDVSRGQDASSHSDPREETRKRMQRMSKSLISLALPFHRIWVEQNTNFLMPFPKARSQAAC